MSFKIVEDENGNKELVRDPRSGYRMARSQGNMILAVHYLSQERDDWFSLLLESLSKAHRIPLPTIGILLCLSYVRRPVPVEKLVEWTNDLMGGEWEEGLKSTVDWLIRVRERGSLAGNNVASTILIPFEDDRVQIGNGGKWDLPDLEPLWEKEG